MHRVPPCSALSGGQWGSWATVTRRATTGRGPVRLWLLSSLSTTTDCVCPARVVDLREWLLATYPGFEGPNKRTMWLRQKFSCVRAMRQCRRFHLLCILMRRQRNTLSKPSCRLLKCGWSKPTALFPAYWFWRGTGSRSCTSTQIGPTTDLAPHLLNRRKSNTRRSLSSGRSKATEWHNASMNVMVFGLSEEPTATTKRESQTSTIGGSGEMSCPMTVSVRRGRRQAHWRP